MPWWLWIILGLWAMGTVAVATIACVMRQDDLGCPKWQAVLLAPAWPVAAVWLFWRGFL